ncbi:MAG TPA: hypothetical protein VNK48_15545 [Xanthobacteraceae bacterium]|nr:hypothetical protein [Xanthobacteraceae bacterium]
MHIGLFLLGLLTAAAGFIAIGFGIPVHAFSFGNTLIIAGATAAVGGLLLIGLAAAVHQLKRIADANAMHGASLAANSVTDPFAAQASFLGAAKSESMTRGMPIEPRLAAAPSAEPDTAIAWLRPKDAEPTLGERAVIEEMEASLAPQPPQPPRSPQGLEPPQQPPQAQIPQRPPANAAGVAPARTSEPKTWTPLGSGAAAQPSRTDALRTDRPQDGNFDTVWPGPARSAETVERARRSEAAKPAPDERAPRESQAPRATPAEGPRPVAILKSGMIDGMAYTLFADGSIEAVLPTGPIRFASVEALRAHLEKSG